MRNKEVFVFFPSLIKFLQLNDKDHDFMPIDTLNIGNSRLIP